MSQRISTVEKPAQVIYRGNKIAIKRGVTITELQKMYPAQDDDQMIAAVVNNRTVSLEAPILRSGTVEPVMIRSRQGARMYRRHLTMMLYAAFGEAFPDATIRVGQAISEGVYFEISNTTVDQALVDTLRKGIARLAKKCEPFVFERVPVEEARRIFANEGQTTKRIILDHWPSAHVAIMHLSEFSDFCLGPVAPHTGYFSDFRLDLLEEDILLRPPALTGPDVSYRDDHQPKLYATHKRSQAWTKQLGISNVAALNTACIDGSVRELIMVAEGRHEKRISEIAHNISSSRDRRLVFVSGPSSAGKTTFAKRLSVQLRVAGKDPKALSLDNYYVDRKKTPTDAGGNYDFEALEAIDLDMFNNHLRRILAGERVETPIYNFQTGVGERDKTIPIELGENGVLVIEGIHGLNDELTRSISAARKFRIYINALSPLCIDEHNRLHTSDARLIRRIVRDRHYRGYSAAQTIETWPSVRRGEKNHIFPYQESADVIFNTSLIYEFSVLKIFADRYLLEVPRSHPSFAEAYRLRKFLSMFVTVLPADVPHTSLMREFIGGSGFSY